MNLSIFVPIQRLDIAFSQMCLCHRFNHNIAQISKSVSHTGDGHLYALFAILVWFLDRDNAPMILSLGLSAFLLELPIYWCVKNGLKRARPFEVPSFITPSDRYSLPSGHTAAAVIMACLISAFYPDVSWFVCLWATCIGLSRILLGVHYLTDILAGFMLGYGCFSFVWWLL